MAPCTGSVRRFGVFNLVALGGFTLQMAVLSLLTRVLDFHFAVATAIGIEVALLHNFAGHSRWTWADRPAGGARRLMHRLGRYQAAKSLTLGANLALTAWLVRDLGLTLELANVVAVVALSLVNYLLSDRLIFSDGRLPATWRAYVRLIKFPYHVTFLNVVFGALIFATTIDLSLALRLVALYGAFNVLFYSGIYTLNDLADRDADRRHPKKRHRPIAAGIVPARHAVPLAAGLIAVGLFGGACFGPRILTCFVVVLLLNLAYSGGGRNIVGLDVVLNAAPHVVRFAMGALLVDRMPSGPHLLAFFLVAVAISCLRRDVELDIDHDASRATLRRYTSSTLATMTLLSLSVFVVMLQHEGVAAPGFYATLAASTVVLVGGAYFSVPGRRVLRWFWTR